MIEHHPYGIDDPYKRLPTERSPRDPQPHDDIHIGFVCLDASSAWVMVNSSDGETRIEGQALGDGHWVAALGAFKIGSYHYRIHAQSNQGVIESAAHPFEIGRWFEAATVLELLTKPNGLQLTLASDDGLGKINASLTVPIPGVCRLEFGHAVTGEDGGEACQATRFGNLLRVVAADIKLELILESLELRIQHADSSELQCTTSLRVRWLELPSGQVTHFEAGWTPDSKEALYGLGERFDAPDKRGRTYDVRVYEEYKEQGERTYLPVPFVISSKS